MDYCVHYIKQSIKSAYFNYKNSIVADVASELNIKKIVDLGSNVNSIIKDVGLRSKLEKLNIDYFGLDLDPSYFSPTFIKQISEINVKIYSTPKGIVGDIENLPFVDKSVEAVCVLDVLEHVNNPSKL